MIRTVGDAIRWACVLEATAPKPGNVHPGREFDDLSFAHFAQAAEIAAVQLSRTDLGWGQRIESTVVQTRRTTGTNVNLGIALLIAPLVEAVTQTDYSASADATSPWWRFDSVESVLSSISVRQSRAVFRAIAHAMAGGMNPSDESDDLEMDVHDDRANHDDLMAAMRLASDRDAIAREYASGFDSLLHQMTPLLKQCIDETGGTIQGICLAQHRWLQENTDSLIARKCGSDVASKVRQWFREADFENPSSIRTLDERLRSDGNRLNPGTTADLLAAALFVLLCPTPLQSERPA
ncbi:ATP:dephospho-CoA triphosphoribosyl transferase [Crateriforma conspicua]|uniref:ATP:dephospho-CoA triphosphoribosyl transferase n=2 Tax=Crateriforma conspicua TaxID=2527996 RepID=A0A5C5Y4T9_9PLAN|nr:ATP:dephospho-CoA triphosphoribosyl transferase [Crateriforma conspicua]TWT69889.1 ATP:dephospho-CoA triphosphoribosyl transferase [Crateriforma conspicua]